MGIRVHEIAKEIEVTSKEVIAQLADIGVDVKGHMSSVDEETAEKVKKKLAGSSKKAAKKVVKKRQKGSEENNKKSC